MHTKYGTAGKAVLIVFLVIGFLAVLGKMILFPSY